MTTRSNRIDLLAGTAAILLVANPLVNAVDAQQPAAAPAQAVGRITGRIVDAESGQGLSDVGIQVVGTTIGTQSGVDGRYTLPRVPAGTVTIQARRIGYAPKTITGVMLPADGVLEQNISLSTASVQLSAQVVTASAERGTVNEALDRQRSATGIVNSVTSEQIAKSPDGDAAAAAQRVSGVTVTDGKYLNVRGVGDRYVQATLNGVRIPSPEPERKVVPLDLFPTGLLQSITTSKTFTPDQPGDFSGAVVDIQTKEFPARRAIAYSISTGINDAAVGRTVLRAPTVGREWLGLAGTDRSLPFLVGYYGNFAGFTQGDFNRLGQEFRNSWTPTTQSGIPNSSTSASIGGQDAVFGHNVGYVLSGSYGFAQEVRDREVRAGAQGISDTETREVNRFTGSTARQSVLWGGLLNLSTMVGARSRIAFNNTYNRTADNEARVDSGVFEPLSADIRRTTVRYIERTIRSNQLRGEHALTPAQQVDWSLTSSGVTRDEPDRADNVYVRQPDPVTGALQPYALLDLSNDGARRTYGELRENSLTGSANYRVGFGPADRQTIVKVGAMGRQTTRDASNFQYAMVLNGGALTQEQRQQTLESIFVPGNLQDESNVFTIRNLGFGGSYAAEDRLGAGYAMVEYPLADRLRLIGGARVEHANIDVTSTQTSGAATTAAIENTDVLPSLALNLQLTHLQNLRVSASRTLARPEYRELSPVNYADVLGGELLFGNPSLRRSLIENYDVRWELYPGAGEVLSVGVFAKRFHDPIERVDVATSGQPQVTFVNAEGATNYGVELEARKSLGVVAERLANVTAFSNLTLMRSEITIGNSQIASRTNDSRPMVGQAPYLVNAGLTWTATSGRGSATVLFNRVGERIVAAGTNPLPDTYEQPRNMLDLSLRFPVWGAVAGKVDLRNALDARTWMRQGTVTRESYFSGRVATVGLSWRP